MARYIESAFNPEQEKNFAQNESPLNLDEKIEALGKGAEIVYEKNPRFVGAVRELVEEYGNPLAIPFGICIDLVEKGDFGYEPEMVYALGKIIEKSH